MARVFNTDIQNFQHDVLEAKVPVLLELFNDYCRYCQILEPFIDALDQRYMDRDLDIIKLNIDASGNQQQINEIIEKYGLRAVPTVYLIKNGHVIEEKRGPSPFQVASIIQRNT